MKKLHVGTLPDGTRVCFPLELASLTMAVLGIRGSGKTVTVSVLVEELIKVGIPVVVIDPTNSWFGLKSSADGKRPGYPVVILGGPQGDLPLHEDAGHTIAKFVVTHPGSYILSLRHLRKGAQKRLVTAFLEELYYLKGEPQHQTPLFVAIDEASQFVPQKVGLDQAQMVGAVQDIIRLGRNSGFGIALIDQRPASVNKDALTQLELLVCHRITAPQDRAALLDWVKQNDSGDHKDEFLRQLAKLPNGHAWFWAPTMDDLFTLVHVRMRETFDSSKTPKIGERPLQPTAVAAVDLDALKTALQVTLEEAAASDPKALKTRIAELEREVEALQTAETLDQVSNGDAEAAEQLGYNEGHNRGLMRGWDLAMGHARPQIDRANEVMATFGSLVRLLADHVGALGVIVQQTETFRLPDDGPADADEAHELEQYGGVLRAHPAQFEAALAEAGLSKVSKQNPPQETKPRTPSTNGNLPKGEVAVLTAACQYPKGVTREQLSVLTGYKRSSRDAYIQRLREKSLVHAEGDRIMAAAGAESHLGNFTPLPTGAALRQYWLDRLPTGETAILRVLIDAYPREVSRAALDTVTGYKRSSRDAYLQRLRSRQLVETESGGVRASATLFTGGRK
ncbi:MAG: helicase HerA domain-containing protein [Longimicrobiales bacterium]